MSEIYHVELVSVQKLSAISTMGFSGEALARIGQAASLMTTKTKDSLF